MEGRSLHAALLGTNVERSDSQKVLDGGLDEFMAASLAARVGEGGKERPPGVCRQLRGLFRKPASAFATVAARA